MTDINTLISDCSIFADDKINYKPDNRITYNSNDYYV